MEVVVSLFRNQGFQGSALGQDGVLDTVESENRRSLMGDDESRFEPLFKLMDWSKGSTVIEPACGSGRITSFLAESVGPKGKIISCDLSHQMIRRLKNRQIPENVYCVLAGPRFLPVETGACNGVVCFNSFQQFADKARCLREFNRVLENNGMLWIVDFDRADLNFGNSPDSLVTNFSGTSMPLSQPVMESFLDETGFKLRMLRDNPQGYILSALKNAE